MQKYGWNHLNTNKLLSWPICRITKKGQKNFQRVLKQQLWLLNYSSANGSPTVRATHQPDAGKAEEKQNVTQKEAFLPHHQDRNFFLP